MIRSESGKNQLALIPEGGLVELADLASEILEARHSSSILVLLREQTDPVPTKDIRTALGIRNWYTVSKTLSALRAARLVTEQDGFIGPYRSRAKFWSLEPMFGARVAEALREAERWVKEATAKKRAGR